MDILKTILENKYFFSWTAFIMSVIFGVRGVFYTIRLLKKEVIETKDKLEYKGIEYILHCFQDFVYNFASSLTGFVSIYFNYKIYLSIRSDLDNIGSGTALLMIFLTVFGAIGISGALPRIFWRGGFTKAKD